MIATAGDRPCQYPQPCPLQASWRQDGSAWEEPDAALEGFLDQDYRLLRGGSWFD